MFGNLGLRYRRTEGQYYENADHKQTNGLWGVMPRLLGPE